jgi:hypothetical protein
MPGSCALLSDVVVDGGPVASTLQQSIPAPELKQPKQVRSGLLARAVGVHLAADSHLRILDRAARG